MFFHFNNLKIAGIACAVPDDVETSDQWNEFFGEEAVRKFIQTTGIEQRYVGNRLKVTASDLCCEAAKVLMDKGIFTPQEVDAVIFMGYHRDYENPITALVLQHRLGLSEECVCIDVPLGCSAYPNGLYLAGGMLNSGCETILLLSGDARRKCPEHPKTIPMLFGEAGSATLIRRQENSAVSGLLRSYGEDFQKLIVPYGGSRHPLEELIEQVGIEQACTLNAKHYMDGYRIMSFCIENVVHSMQDFLVHFDKTADDFDAFALHQANKIIMKSMAKKMKIPWEKILLSIQKYANTTCASIPVTLCHCFGDVHETTEKQIFSSGYGIGLSAGIASFAICPQNCFPIIKTKNYFDDGINPNNFS